MRRNARANKGKDAVTLLLLCLICILYISTASPAVKTVMSVSGSGPVYRGYGKGEAALLMCVDWDASALDGILDTLKNRGIKLTVAVSGEWAADNRTKIKRIVNDGHELAVTGMTRGDGDAKWLAEDIKTALGKIYETAGVSPKLYYSGTRSIYASSDAARSLGLTHILYSTDLLCARGNAEEILKRALDNPFEGSIMLIQPTKECDAALSGIIDGLAERGISISTVGKIISNGTG